MRATSRGSLKKIIPKTTVPTAPMPVQTAYAVPSGMVLRAWERKKKLTIIAATVPRLGQNRVKPLVALSPTAQTISNTPARKRSSQAFNGRSRFARWQPDQ